MSDSRNFSQTTFEQVARALGLDESFANRKANFARSAGCFKPGEMAVIQPAYLREWGLYVGLPNEAVEALVAASKDYRENEMLQLWLWHWYCELFKFNGWPDDFLKADPATRPSPIKGAWQEMPESLGSAGRLFYAYVLLAGLPFLCDRHAERNVPSEVTQDTSSDITLLMRQYQQKHGRWGMPAMNWPFTHFTLRLFQLGRLQFELSRFDPPFRIYKHRKTRSLCALAEAGLAMRPDGQHDGANKIFAGDDAWQTTLVEDDAQITGHLADADGNVMREPSTLDMAEWKCVMKRGDMALGVHIPAGGNFDETTVAAAFAESLRFFPRYFPDWDFKGYWCASWLMDAQLAEYLKPESNIVRFLRMFHTLPCKGANDFQTFERVFGGYVDIETAPQENSLQRAIVEHVKAGKHWRYSIGFIERKDLAKRLGV